MTAGPGLPPPDDDPSSLGLVPVEHVELVEPVVPVEPVEDPGGARASPGRDDDGMSQVDRARAARARDVAGDPWRDGESRLARARRQLGDDEQQEQQREGDQDEA